VSKSRGITVGRGGEADCARAVIYAAKSTEDKHGSIPTQLEDGRKLAAARGFEVVAEHQDVSKSAYSGDRGSGLAEAMAACERLSAEHGTAALIVQRSDRLARGDAKQARSLVEIVLWAIKSDVRLFSVQDPEMFPEGEMALLLGAIGGLKGHGESKVKGESVSKGMRRAAERGKHTSRAPFGYRWERDGEVRRLAVEPSQAAVVRKVYADYVSGESLRAITQALNASGTPTARGGSWRHGVVSKLLSNVIHTGKLSATDEEGNHLAGEHEALIDGDTFARVQAIKAGNERKGGRRAEGGHLLVRGMLRCVCGSAMKPMRGVPGHRRDAYCCSGRIERGAAFCDQPSLPRAAVDEPFLASMLESYVDVHGMRKRIEAQASSELALAGEAVNHSAAEAASAAAMLARVRRHYREGRIEPEDWTEQRDDLEAGAEAAREAAERASEHRQCMEASGPVGDAEGQLLEALAEIKRAVASDVERARGLDAVRHTITSLFERVQLIEDGDLSVLDGYQGEGMAELDAESEVGSGRRWTLLPVLRDSAVDELDPIKAELPVGPREKLSLIEG
jgi:DNA invertase Pin-like site-specific DNA recombinase